MRVIRSDTGMLWGPVLILFTIPLQVEGSC